jgi:hypothetical protein
LLFRGVVLGGLTVALILGVLFVWRSWRRMPGLAVLTAAAATVAGIFILKNPFFAGMALVAILLTLTYLARPPRK